MSYKAYDSGWSRLAYFPRKKKRYMEPHGQSPWYHVRFQTSFDLNPGPSAT
jgi:hypothetical protein